MKKATFFLFLLIVVSSADLKAQVFDVDTLQYKSNPSLINFVILGDGYTVQEQDKFVEDARRFQNYYFSQNPMSFYKDYYNIFLIKVVSEESGVKHPHTALDCPDSVKTVSNPKNYFGSTFDRLGIHRLVAIPNTAQVGRVLAANFPTYDQVTVIANSKNYGGSGGAFPVTTASAASNEIAVHELAHAFAGLADEYWAGQGYVAESANLTQEADPALVRWKDWLGYNGVGIYSYGKEAPRSIWYRPHETCKMQFLGFPFCAVCSEAIVESIHRIVNPVSNVRPSSRQVLSADSVLRFSVTLVRPSPNTLKTQWYVNEALVGQNSEAISLSPGVFTKDTNVVRFTMIDTTTLVRADEHFQRHRYFETWKVKRSLAFIPAPQLRWDTVEVCAGKPASLTVQNPENGSQYFWYDDSTSTNSIGQGSNFSTPMITTERRFYVATFAGGQSSKRTKVHIKVLPLPAAPQAIRVDEPQAEICYGTPAKLRVAQPDSMLNYRWYQVEKGTVRSLGEDTLMMTPPLTSQTTYYVASLWKKTGCLSETRTRVVLPVTAKPEKPVVTVSSIKSKSVTFTWKPVGASGYLVSMDEGRSFQEASSGAQGLTHTVKKLKKGEIVNIIVQAIFSNPCSTTSYSERVKAITR